MEEKKHYNVVAGVVVAHGKVLCVRKGETRFFYTSHKWEFPGGKIEDRERPEAALRRELLEEMSMTVDVGERLTTVIHHYPDFSITMQSYMCRLLNPEFRLKEHQQQAWLEPDRLLNLDWCAADVPIAKAVSDNAASIMRQ